MNVFFNNSSLEQKKEFLKENFKNPTEEYEFSFSLSMNINQDTLLKYLDNVSENFVNRDKAFETMSSILDFVKENDYQNVSDYESKIKSEIVKKINRVEYDKVFF